MAAPVIAIGVYELFAADAAAIGIGAVAIAKRRELTEGLSDAAGAMHDTFRKAAVQSLPYIIGATTGSRPFRPRAIPDAADAVSISLPLPGFADPAAWDAIGVPAWAGLPALPRPGVRETATGRTLTDLGNVEVYPPEDPPPSDPLKPLQEGLNRLGRAIIRHPLFKAYQYITLVYGGLSVLFPSEEKGPFLYGQVWKRFIGESVEARAFFGLLEVVAAESFGGMLAVAIARRVGPRLPARLATIIKNNTPSFAQVNLAALLGGPSFYQYQMTANNTASHDVDVVRATRNAFFLGFTSTLFFPLKDMIIGQ